MQTYYSSDHNGEAQQRYAVLGEERPALLLRAFRPSVSTAALRAPLLALLKELGLLAALLRLLLGVAALGRAPPFLLGEKSRGSALIVTGHRHRHRVHVEAAELFFSSLAGTGHFDFLLAVGYGGAGAGMAGQGTSVPTAQHLQTCHNRGNVLAGASSTLRIHGTRYRTSMLNQLKEHLDNVPEVI